jgi:tetratricopeptide (TPR) repeat protein
VTLLVAASKLTDVSRRFIRLIEIIGELAEMTIKPERGALAQKYCLVGVMLSAIWALPWEARASEESKALEIDVMLESWQVDNAAPIAEKFLSDYPDSSFALWAVGRARFFQGDYKDAVELIDRAIAQNTKAPKDWKEFRALAASTRDATKDLLEWKSPKGYFLFRYRPKDEVLLPYAAMALDAAYENLGSDFDLYPKTVIPVEFYGSAEELAKVSTLTTEEIKTSGTIALCKFNRLMVTSPRALLQGYGWMDTVAHEYVHYLVSVKSNNTVPIWLHEGLAKYHEQRWRGTEKGWLPPSQEQILAEALKRGHLITFEQMHPSMAKLPSQDDTALAFAEVFMAVEYVKGQVGAKGIREVMGLLKEGKTVEEAISAVMQVPFSTFIDHWTKYMKAKKYQDRPGLLPKKLVFKTEGKAPPKEDPAESKTHDSLSKEAKKYFRLGELLLAEGKNRAAVVQLEKAKKLDKTYGLALPMKLARAYLSTGLYQAAADAAGIVSDLYPEYVGGWLVGGRALLAKEEYALAKPRLEEAMWLNPFDPDAHKDLKKACQKIADLACVTREEKSLSLLSQ